MPKEKKNHLNNYVVEKRGLAELKVLCHFVIFFVINVVFWNLS